MQARSSEMAGIDRAWLEQLLEILPTPMLLIEPGTGNLMFANGAADRLAGGRFPRGAPEERNTDAFHTVENGRRLRNDELPGMRAARGEEVKDLEIALRTPEGDRSLLVQGVKVPSSHGQPEMIVLLFEDVTQLKEAERAKSESLALLDALFADAPIGLAYFDADLRYRRVNEKLAELNGVPAEQHIGRTVPEVLPDMDARVDEELRKVLETGRPAIDIDIVGATPGTGEEHEFSTSFYPVRDADGKPVGVGAVALDVTDRRRAEAERANALALEQKARAEAEQAAARARFLAEASVILDESLDYEATLSTISRLVVPWLADWCTVDMPDADGSLRRVTTAHVDPDKVQLAREWADRYPTDPASPTGAPNVMRTGTSEIYPEVTDEMLQAGARDEEHLELIRSLGMRSAMVVPMITRGRTLGAITFISAETGRQYDEYDRLVAEELARRAATSVDNARLYGERSYIARTLQQSLLPPHLPEIPGIELAGLYRPAGEGNDVGGDFYDLFELGEDCWAVVIGDVCGKGADAAALTALVRYTIRAIASSDIAPSETLRLLNDAILRQRSDDRFCTVAYARVTKSGDGGARVELASGGHPLPLVMRAAGGSALAGRPGTLLGIVPDPTLHDVSTELAPGDALVLYTDGVSESGAPDRLFDPEDLAAVIEGCEATSAVDVAGCLERMAVETSSGHPHDDIAIVVLQVDGSGLELAPATGAPTADIK